MTKRRGRGEGSIHQRHDHPTCPALNRDGTRPGHRCRGTWVAVLNGSYVNGKRDRRNFYGKTRAEVQAKLDEAKKRTPTTKPSTIPTVEQWLTEWITQHKSDVRTQSHETYRKKIDAYLIPLLGPTRLDRLTALQIEALDTRLRMPCPEPTPDGKCPHTPSHGLSYSTARLVYTILKDALGDAVKARKILDNPGTNAKGPSKKRTAGVAAPRPERRLSTSVADIVLEVAQSQGDAARWWCALEMGLRQGEALGLPWSLLDLEREEMSILRTLEPNGAYGLPKSAAGERTIPILPNTLAALKRRRAHILAAGGTLDPDGRVFGGSADADRQAWRRLLESAGVPHVKLHSARQTAARRFEERGVEARVAAQFFGWEDVKMVYHYQRNAEVEALRRSIHA